MLARLLFRDHRRAHGVEFRVRKAAWVDPYPWINGTVPEKMVFAELARRHIPFTFQADGLPDEAYRQMAIGLGDYQVRPDILLPEYHAVIEVQGDYFHSTPDGLARDQVKFEVYRLLGYQVYPIFEREILRSVAAEIDRVLPFFRLPVARTGRHDVGVIADDTAALRARNKRRARPPAYTLKRRVRRGRRTA